MPGGIDIYLTAFDEKKEKNCYRQIDLKENILTDKGDVVKRV